MSWFRCRLWRRFQVRLFQAKLASSSLPITVSQFWNRLRRCCAIIGRYNKTINEWRSFNYSGHSSHVWEESSETVTLPPLPLDTHVWQFSTFVDETTFAKELIERNGSCVLTRPKRMYFSTNSSTWPQMWPNFFKIEAHHSTKIFYQMTLVCKTDSIIYVKFWNAIRQHQSQTVPI